MGSASGTDFPAVSDAWFRLWSDLFTSTLEANRAAIGAFERSTATTPRLDPAVPEVAYREPDWVVERSVDSAADLAVGDWVRFTKRITDEEVRAFARISGDTNRLHLDEGFAEDTRFEGRIAHGTLLSGLISAALARLPGLTIYLSQELEFRHPVRIGETVTGNCEVTESLGGDRYRVETTLHNEDGEVIIAGEAVVLIDDLPTTARQ
ncbi:MaoC family dehydratase [Halococcus hamelinensis]|uniref:Enoyl-CoA hydratase n=1 Tax=Halococcus hamelinensis 100A6 TaxID=1132509 RepID=M0M9U9_9EURY|nr:MaoC family dehydratase [Halococcus hamelinensis]EMA41414.1 enoyl-CoA hydratase [Halococcus hamelinensis 100A6]